MLSVQAYIIACNIGKMGGLTQDDNWNDVSFELLHCWLHAFPLIFAVMKHRAHTPLAE